jgi:hypothetical protein
MNLKDITKKYLKENGFDGLFNADGNCACKNDDLMPCGESSNDCTAGYLAPCKCGEHYFHIQLNKYVEGSTEENKQSNVTQLNVISIGNAMSNILYNLAQKDCCKMYRDELDEVRKQWDEAYHALRKPVTFWLTRATDGDGPPDFEYLISRTKLKIDKNGWIDNGDVSFITLSVLEAFGIDPLEKPGQQVQIGQIGNVYEIINKGE